MTKESKRSMKDLFCWSCDNIVIKTTFHWGKVANWGMVIPARTPVKSMDIWGHFWLVIGISMP